MFKKLSGTKKSVYVAEQIMKNIQSGKLEVGNKIPSEQLIAEEIGVSRTAVREALAALELSGIVERRAGDGTYVTGYLPLSFNQAIRILQEDEGSIEAIEARSIVEPGLAELACERMSEGDISVLESILDKMRLAAEKNDVDEFIDADYHFHSYLAKCSKNPVLEITMEQYLYLMRKQLWKYIKSKCIQEKGQIGESVEVHRAVVDALKGKDKKNVRQEMKRHFDEIFELF